jgi:hypothetical protein
MGLMGRLSFLNRGNRVMSDLNTVDRPRRRRRRRPRKHIVINGKTWKPRVEIATDNLDTTDRNLQRKNYRTFYQTAASLIAAWRKF